MILFHKYLEHSGLGEVEREYRFHLQPCELNLGSCLYKLIEIIEPLKFMHGSNKYSLCPIDKMFFKLSSYITGQREYVFQGDISVDLSDNKKQIVNHVNLKHPLLSIRLLKLLIHVYLRFDDFFRVIGLFLGGI